MSGIGSLKYLHTFAEVSYIYGIDSSTIRKKTLRGELKKGIEVEKFGGTWVITEQAMIKHFGARRFEEYIRTGEVSKFEFSIGKITAKEKIIADEDSFII